MPLRFNASALSSKRLQRIIYRGFLLFLIVAPVAGRVVAQTAPGATALEPGKPVERELAGGQSHSYSIALTAGQYLHVVVDQRGIDVVVTLFGAG